MPIHLESPDQPDVLELIAELDAYQDRLYPPEARYALDLTSLQTDDIVFVVARDASGQAIGCGAVVLTPPVGELKRMYVRPAHRGSGIARQIFTCLEAEAARRGCALLQLETGPRQPEALAFYARHGFARCGAFGSYPEHPLSIFMEKTL
jgi:putative acetyltransferase